MPLTLQFLIEDVDGNSLISAGLIVENLEYSHQSPGGCLACSFQVKTDIRALPDYLGAAYDVLIKGGGKNIWRGYIDKLRVDAEGPYGVFNITAVGYGAHLEDGLDSTENVQNTQTSTIIANTITNHAPKITAQSIAASGFTLSNATAITLTDMKPIEIINWALRFGNSSDVEQLYETYPDDTEDAVATFTLKARPTTPDYFIDLKDFKGSWGFDFEAYANRILVRYNDGASSVTVEDTAAQGAGPTGVNRIRTHYLDMPQITQSADATQVGQVELEKRGQLRMNLESITLGGDARVMDSNFEDVPLEHMRAGKMIQLRGLVAADQSQGALTWNTFALIARVEYNQANHTVIITPESFEDTFDFIVAQAAHGAKGAA